MPDITMPDQTSTPDDSQMQPTQTVPAAGQPQQGGSQAPQQATQSLQLPSPQPPQPEQQSASTAPPAQASAAPAPTPAPATLPPPSITHPAMQRASLFRSLAETLAGGPRYTVTIDPSTGLTKRTPIALTRKDIGLAITLEALSGALGGLSVTGPGSVGRAGAVGLEQGEKIAALRQASQQQVEQQAQSDAQSQQAALVRKASIFETNARAIQNVSTAEMMGSEALDKLIEINRKNGSADLPESSLDNGGQPLTQDELMKRLQSGSLSAGDALGPIVGREEVTDADGTKRWQGLHLVIRDPNQKVGLSQDSYDYFASQGVPGYKAGITIGPDTQIPFRMIQNASEIAGAHELAVKRLDGLRTVLQGTAYEGQTPTTIDFQKPGVNGAFETLNRYIHRNSENLADPYLAIQAMAQGRRDPQTGEMIPNRDASAAPIIMDALGGPELLLAAHQQILANQKTTEQYNVIDSIDKAQAVISNPRRFTPDQVSSAKSFVAMDTQHKASVAEAGADARASVKAAVDAASSNAVSGTPDALGFTPNPTAMGGIKEYNKKLNVYKKNFDDLARTESSYQQFGDILHDIAAGKDMTGAQSVVGLFNAIGLSATPLAGRGFRVSQNTIAEHQQARGWGQALQAKLLNAKSGDVITPQQMKDYASIAVQARQSQYINLANEMHSSGLSADPALPTGNGQKIDPSTAQIFLHLTGNNPQRARAAATAKGWSF